MQPVKLTKEIAVPAVLSTLILAIAMLGMVLVSTVRAEEATPTPTPTPITETASPSAPAISPAPQRFYLEVDQSDLQALSQALNELPKRVADPIILKLNAQLQPAAQSQIVENKAAAEKSKRGKK